mgnify:CR=1 FL=1
MLQLLQQLSDNKYVAGVAVAVTIGIWAWIVQSMRDRRDRTIIHEYLRASAATGRYSFRSTTAIASDVRLAVPRVQELCSTDSRIRRNARDAESWTLADTPSKSPNVRSSFKWIAGLCIALAAFVAAAFVDKTSRNSRVSLTVNGSEEDIVLVKGEFYVYEWNTTSQKTCDFESPFGSSVTLTGRSNVTPGEQSYYPAPNRPVTLRLACTDAAGRVTRKEVTVRMAPD